MFNNKERKLARLRSGLSSTLSDRVYNLIIGAMLVYGFAANALMVAFCGDFFLTLNPWVVIIGYFACVVIGSMMATKSHNPVFSFIGYNLIAVPIGVLLTICLPGYPMNDIISAILITGVITVVITVASTIYPKFFRGLGKTLFFSLLIGLVVELIAILLGYGGTLFDWIFVLIFSLYIGYDYCKAQDYPKTTDNAIDSAIDLYLDIINVFLRILSIISRADD